MTDFRQDVETPLVRPTPSQLAAVSLARQAPKMLSNRVTTPRGAAGPLPLGFGAHHEQLVVEQLPLVYHYVCVPFID